MSRRKYVSPYFSPDRHTADQIVGYIDHTEKTLDCAVYSVTHEDISNALIRAHNRGVKVRLLVDKTQAGSRYSRDEELEAAGIPLLRDRKGGLMHHKFAISDGDISGQYAVITGSFNWTVGADERNAENAVIIRLKGVVREFQEEFDRVWLANSIWATLNGVSLPLHEFMTYKQLALIAGYDPYDVPTVTYRDKDGAGTTLYPGSSVRVTRGSIINCTMTDSA